MMKFTVTLAIATLFFGNLLAQETGHETKKHLITGGLVVAGIFFDFKEGIDTRSLSVAFGKEFKKKIKANKNKAINLCR